MLTAISLTAILLVAVDAQVFPSFLTRLGGNATQQGLLLASMFLLYPVSSVAAGFVADRSGKRLVVGAGVLCIAMAFALSALLQGIGARTLLVLLFGLGAGVVESQVSALLSDAHPERGRSILNFSQTLFSAGAAGGPFLIAMIYTFGGSVPLPVLLGFLAALNGVTAAGFLFRSRSERSMQAGAPHGLGRLLTDRGLLALALSVFLYVGAEMGTAGWLAKYGELELALSPELAPICISLFWGGLGVSRTLVGALPHRTSDRNLLLAAIALTLAARVFTFLLPGRTAGLVGITVLGVGMGSVWPTIVALAGQRFRGSSGTAIGIVVAAGALAIPVVQLLIGVVSQESLLGLRGSMLSLGLFSLLNLILVARIFPAEAPA
jgi:fucose permease